MPTLEVLEERLRNMDEKLDRIVDSVLCEESGLIIKVDRLEQSEKFKNRVLWALFVCVLGLVGHGLASFASTLQTVPTTAVQTNKR